MKYLSSQKGAALVVVLAMVVISTAVLSVVLHFIHRGTQVSGLEQKYETAKDASYGALEVFAKEIIPAAIGIAQVTPATSITASIANFKMIAGENVVEKGTTSDACFADKLLKKMADWAAVCSRSTDPKTSPDITFTLQGRGAGFQPFKVYTKIVDTVTGNSDTSGTQTLYSADAVAASGSGIIATQHIPYMYSMEVQGERKDNPVERANLEVLYAY